MSVMDSIEEQYEDKIAALREELRMANLRQAEEIKRYREVLEEIARGSDDVDRTGTNNLPFDAYHVQRMAQAALTKTEVDE